MISVRDARTSHVANIAYVARRIRYFIVCWFLLQSCLLIWLADERAPLTLGDGPVDLSWEQRAFGARRKANNAALSAAACNQWMHVRCGKSDIWPSRTSCQNGGKYGLCGKSLGNGTMERANRPEGNRNLCVEKGRLWHERNWKALSFRETLCHSFPFLKIWHAFRWLVPSSECKSSHPVAILLYISRCTAHTERTTVCSALSLAMHAALSNSRNYQLFLCGRRWCATFVSLSLSFNVFVLCNITVISPVC